MSAQVRVCQAAALRPHSRGLVWHGEHSTLQKATAERKRERQTAQEAKRAAVRMFP